MKTDHHIMLFCYIIKHTATTGGLTLLPTQTIDPAAQSTSVEFTNIPTGALEITVMFEGVSLSGTDDFEIQLGTASGYIVSNYDSLSQNEGGADKRNSTTSFILRSDNASHVRTGSMLIKKHRTLLTFKRVNLQLVLHQVKEEIKPMVLYLQ